MNGLIKGFVFVVAVLIGQGAQSDFMINRDPDNVANAEVFVSRLESAGFFDRVDQRLRRKFVDVYFEPIEERNVRIADAEAFANLIPEADVAPRIANYRDSVTELTLMMFADQHLEGLAALMLADEEATFDQILTGALTTKYRLALEEAESATTSSNTVGLQIEELRAQLLWLEEFREMMEETTRNGSMGTPKSFEWAVMTRLGAELIYISKIEVEANNPVTLAAIETDGVLRFANLVQRNRMAEDIRAMTSPVETVLDRTPVAETSGGIQFIRPPATD